MDGRRKRATRAGPVCWITGLAFLAGLVAAPAARASAVMILDPVSGKEVEATKVEAERQVTVRSGELTGTLRRPDGTVVGGTTVVLTDAATGKKLQTVTTTEQGGYTFTDVSKGQKVLVAGAPGVAAVLQAKDETGTSTVTMVVPNAATAESTSEPDDPAPAPTLGSPTSTEGDGVVVTGGVFTASGFDGNSTTSGVSDPMP
ncbi:MAG: hypothetical protein ACOC8E_01050 [Planctomycetota bacterium]